MNWTPSHITDLAATAIRDEEARREREQHFEGIDALDELELHDVLERAFRADGLGVHREQPYPSGDPHARPKDNARDRCDLVLTPSPELELIDPVALARERDDADQTLFAAAHREGEHARLSDAGTVGTDEALWLEVKLTGRYRYREGVPTPNRSFGVELVHGPNADARKLSKAPGVEHAAALVVAFAETETHARDFAAKAVGGLLDLDAPIYDPTFAFGPIADRIGNAAFLVATFRVMPNRD